MFKLTYEGLKDQAAWQTAGITLPRYDLRTMQEKTLETPSWLHFGAGNIFRGYIAALQNDLLNQEFADTGIIAVESFDFDIIDKIYEPHDALTLMVTLKADGTMEKSVIGSIAKGLTTRDLAPLRTYFEMDGLQIVSFTITEKGYSLTGRAFEIIQKDMEAGPQKPVHVMAIVTSLLLSRYQAGAAPLSLVSMDNCSHNGEKLQQAVYTIAEGWVKNGFAEDGFLAYLREKVAFPWSMIDKITPRPADSVKQALIDASVEDMEPIVTSMNTYIAPFVNAEAPQYLVIEDAFPNGRPALEKAGVFIASRDTVNKVERMKVTTCLNPLHTALAVYGCLLGYDLIADEMKDPQLSALAYAVGYTEGLPVVTDPGIINPKDFLDEVFRERFPNRFMPDTPQRIATDTSQKVGVRFGETIKSYLANETLSVENLTAIPLVLAGWLRYLLGVDDNLNQFTVNSDPLLDELQQALKNVSITDGAQPQDCTEILHPILSNQTIFGVDLYAAGLAQKITAMFEQMLQGKGAVRRLLTEYFPSGR